MADETKAAAAEEVVVVSDVKVAEKPKEVAEKEVPPQPQPEPEPEPEKPATVEEVLAEAEKEKITESASFKEESNVVGELPDPEKKALDELKQLVQEALNKHEFTAPPPPPPPPQPVKEEEKTVEKAEEEKTATATEEQKPDVASGAPAAADVPPPAVAEEPKKPEALVGETKEEEKSETPAAEPPAAETKEVETTPPPAAPVSETSETLKVAEVVEKAEAVVDEDGAKTVEAIKETIVEVSAPSSAPPAEQPSPTDEVPQAEAKEEAKAAAPPPPPEEVSIWGIPLLADERSDVILLKFLRARDFKVKDAFTMLKNVVAWRKEFGIESLLEEDLDISGLEKAFYMHGVDNEGHPVCYNAFGEFQDKELYQKSFFDEEKRTKFLRWRIQFLEKSIRKLDFSPDGINTIVQVNDLKNSPGPFKKELRQSTNQAFQLLQDNYPEFVAKQVFINVPWWYLAFYRMISPFFTQRTKSKFVFAGPSKSAETLLKYITPEQVPVQYGGLSREGEQEFTAADSATEETIKPTSKHTVEIPVTEPSTLVWEARVVGWDTGYGAEFVPSAEGGYTIIVQKSRKITSADEPVISNIFKIGEAGKLVLTFDNQTSKKKKLLLYRTKTKPSD